MCGLRDLDVKERKQDFNMRWDCWRERGDFCTVFL